MTIKTNLDRRIKALLKSSIPPGMLFLRADAAPTLADFKALTDKLSEVTTAFNAKSEDLTKRSDDAMKEVKDKGTLLTQTKGEVDKLLLEHTVLTKEKNELSARLTTLEQEVVKRPGTLDAEASKSIGQRLIEDKDFKAWAAPGANGVRGKHRTGFKAATTSLSYAVSEPSIRQPMYAPQVPRLVQRLFVRDIMNVGQTAASAIFWIKQTGFTNAAAVVSEGAAKPESGPITYDGVMTPVTTIAHIFKASKQIMDDFAMLRTDIDREMRYGLKYVEEREILFGDGTGIHLHGIIPQATAYSHAFVAASHTMIDDIRLAMLQSVLARLPATGIVMHFTDWARIELTKDSTGQYLWANPMRLGSPSLWGLPIVSTEIPDMLGKLLVGGFDSGAQIYDREEMNVEVATENEDDFIKNMLTIRCEERLALAVFRPESFIYGAFTVTT